MPFAQHTVHGLHYHLGEAHEDLMALRPNSTIRYICQDPKAVYTAMLDDGEMSLYHYLMYWATIQRDMED